MLFNLVSESHDLVLSGLVSTVQLSSHTAIYVPKPKSGKRFSDCYNVEESRAMAKCVISDFKI